MANADGSTAEQPPLSRLADALPRLLSDLRQADFDVGTEQYVAACDILVRFTGTSHLLSSLELRATLAGIFCTSPSEQNRFPEIFDPWYRGLRVVSEADAPPPQGPASSPTWLRIGRLDRVRAWLISAATCLLLLGVFLWQLLPPADVPITSPAISQSETTTEAPLPPPTLTTRRLMPREPAEPIVPSPRYRPLWATFGQEAWVGVCSIWGLWVVARLALRQTVLTRRRQRPGEQIRLESLRLAGERGSLFSTPVLSDTWRYLRKFRTMPSSRLNERATIDRTLDAAGYFRPVYRERQVPPAYLLLIDRRHGEDHAAAMAAELEAALRREQIVCTTFNYHEDPRYCRLPGESAMARGPANLAGVYGDRTLLLVGDGDALFDSETGRPQSWMQEFDVFEQKHMLTTDPVWRQHTRIDDLTQVGFQVLPLTPEGLTQLRAGVQTMGGDDPRDFPLPRRFAISPGYWLEERKLKHSVQRDALRELKEYLGAEGFLLLSATAAYPGIYWQLTRALDAQLGLAEINRGLRLRKLARLPWYRYGRMPDCIRVALLRSLDRANRRRISDAYHALIEHRTQDPLSLPVSVPDWTRARAELREMAQVSERHEPLGDRVFADVIRGRKPRLLEFEWASLLPAPFARHHWRSLVVPLLAGAVLIPAAIWVNVWALHSWLEPLAHDQSLSAMQAQHRRVRVCVVSPANLVPLSEALEQSLRNWGFTVEATEASDRRADSFPQEDFNVQRFRKASKPTNGSDNVTRVLFRPGRQDMAILLVGDVTEVCDRRADSFLQEQLNVQRNQKGSKPATAGDDVTRISYRPGQKDKAILVAARVAYLTYGAEPALNEEDSLNRGDVDIMIQLGGTLRGFRDPFTGTAAFREPEMVVIQPGVFKMGDLLGKGESDERPVYQVRISKGVAIAKFETTFEEYDHFAQATKRRLPLDLIWGRGRRPVINVSWEDATAYAAWLSQQTGKRYRLPTEAEWEYAARSGGRTEIWAGTSDEQQLADYAVYTANSEGRTAPVGTKSPNGLGLHDLSGNVWEWVEDCWHETYNGAPPDGSAWREVGGGDCSHRMFRGGSWYNNSGLLRVSDRNFSPIDTRSLFIGFRLAQDIP